MTIDSKPRARSGSLVIAALGVACFSFLCVLTLGAVLVVASKMQAPALGSGASPLSVLKTIALVSLGALGVPIEVGDVTVRAVPLGGMLVVVLAARSAARRTVTPRRGEENGASSLPAKVPDGGPGSGLVRRLRMRSSSGERAPRAVVSLGTWLALWLAGLCAAAAALSSFSLGRTDVGARPVSAALFGGMWGAIIAATVLLRPRELRHPAGTRRAAAWEEGLCLGGRAVAWFGALCLAVVVVGGTVRAVTQSSSVPATAGALVHGAAFAPNLAMALGAVALGARVEAGFAPLAEDRREPAYSLGDWRAEETPPAAWALPLIPLVALVGAGLRPGNRGPSHRPGIDSPSSSGDSGAGSGRGSLQTAGVVALGAAIFSAALGAVALVGEARIGLDAAERGFVHLAPDAPRVFLLALGWSAVGLSVSRYIRSVLDRRKSERDPTR